LPHAYCEVVDKDANAVIDEIEATMLQLATTIMQVGLNLSNGTQLLTKVPYAMSLSLFVHIC